MPNNETVPQVNDVSRISAETQARGTITTHSDIRIDGMFNGDIVTMGKLVLGEKGYIKGKIVCHDADIYGKCEGDITSANSANFRSKALYRGNLKTIHVGIEIGASFKGNCSIMTEEEAGKIFAGYF